MTDRTTSTAATRTSVSDEVRVFVVDDHPAFLRTVAFVVAATPGFTLVGTAETGVAALESLASRSDVDLVLLDVNLPDLSGIEVARRRATADATEVTILMSTTDLADLPVNALDRGVAGFLPKERLTTATLQAMWHDVVAT